MTYTQEVWRPIPGYDGYEASNLGRVRSLDRWLEKGSRGGGRVKWFQRGCVLAIKIDPAGYSTVLKGKLVHRLVMAAFRGSPPDGYEVAHNDGNRGNNKLVNLRYDTPLGNQHDRIAHGTHLRGPRNPNAKLTPQDVLVIRSIKGETQTAIGKRFGVTKGCVQGIVSRDSWAWLADRENSL
jgi:hypothetical protein